MKQQISSCIQKQLPEVTEEQVLSLLEIPPEESMGDFALPCFSFAPATLKRIFRPKSSTK